jgi:uncharacterized protein (DUF924 family)
MRGARLLVSMFASSASAAIRSPGDVLSFWFGSQWSQGGMDTKDYLDSRIKMWFMGGAPVDAECQTFAPTIRAAGRGELHGAEWQSRDGLVAQLVLSDQLSRNACRGTAEAFAYDDAAQKCASELIKLAGDVPASLPWPAALFVVTCLMHSEEISTHERVAIFAAAHATASKHSIIERQVTHDLPEHTAVLRQFGRYPHRNALFGHASTAEEIAWLASDKLPGWAKSQGPPPGAK